MKIISLNIAGRSNFGKNYENRMKSIADFLEKEQADIVCLQEVTFNEKESMTERINNYLDSPYRFVFAHMSEKYTFDKFAEPFMEKWNAGLIEHSDDYVTDGVAILSRIPVLHDILIVLKPAPADDRGKPDLRVRVSQIVTFDNGLKLANVHFATNYNSYLQLKELIEYDPVDVIVGDFNMFKEDMEKHRDIWESKYQESFEFKPYISFPSEDATLDYMLIKPEYEFKSIKTVDGLSDHSALVIEIEKK